MTAQRIVVVDTETTGLDPKFGDRIIEVACLELEKGIYPTGRSFHHYINPEYQISEKAFSIHGIHNDFLKDKPLFADIARELWYFISDAVLVIHNAEFDIKFLNSEFTRLGYPAVHMHQTIDTLRIARKKFPGIANNLDALCKRFNISLEDRDKHGALIDVRLLALVYIELTQGGRQQSFLQETQNEAVIMNNQVVIQRKVCSSRELYKPSEIEKHKEFVLQYLKRNNWGYE